MTEILSAGRRKVTERDIDKLVVTSSGEEVGRIDDVAGSGTFAVALAPEGVPYRQRAEDAAQGVVVTFPPEALGFVTPSRVWLRA